MRTNLTSRLGRASAALAIAGLAVFAAGASAEARDYRSWNHHHHWNNGWHNGWNNHWRGGDGGWNGWQSSNGYGYTWPQRYWRAPVYTAPAYYYAPQAYSYYPEPVGPRPDLHDSAALKADFCQRRDAPFHGASFLWPAARMWQKPVVTILDNASIFFGMNRYPACVPSDVSGGIAQCVSAISSAPPSAPVFSSSPPPAAPKPTIIASASAITGAMRSGATTIATSTATCTSGRSSSASVLSMSSGRDRSSCSRHRCTPPDVRPPMYQQNQGPSGLNLNFNIPLN